VTSVSIHLMVVHACVRTVVQQSAYVSRVQERAAAAASRAELENRCKQKLGQIHTAYKNASLLI
jgi:hypothetical protein